MKNVINYPGKGVLAVTIISAMLSKFVSNIFSFLIKVEKRVIAFLEFWGKAAGQSIRS